MRNVPKCKDCAWFEIRISEANHYGIPTWETLECTLHNYHPYSARKHEGLCGTSGKDYKRRNNML